MTSRGRGRSGKKLKIFCLFFILTFSVFFFSFDDSATPSYQLRLQLYEALVGVQRRLISGIVPGETTLDELYRRMQAELGKLLLEFGVFEESYSSGSTAAVAAMTRKICPHHVSHYIGEKFFRGTSF